MTNLYNSLEYILHQVFIIAVSDLMALFLSLVVHNCVSYSMIRTQAL